MIAPPHMPEYTVNLLPVDRQRLVSRDYWLRVGTMLALLLTLLVVAAAVLLLPTYFYLSNSVGAKAARLASMEAALSSAEEAELSARLSVLASDTAALRSLESAPEASATLRALIAVHRTGITLSNISYAVLPGAGTSGTLAVTGAAATREALRAYQLALAGAPFSRGAGLPVSAYAKDANIPFTITVTLAPPGAATAP